MKVGHLVDKQPVMGRQPLEKVWKSQKHQSKHIQARMQEEKAEEEKEILPFWIRTENLFKESV